MTWQNNLMSNLIVFFVLGSLVVIIYCRVTGKTLKDLILDIRGGMADE